MNIEILFLSAFILVLVFILIQFYRASKKVRSVDFPDLDTISILYRDKMGSGQSDRDWQSKMGSAEKTLDIVLTKDELRTRGPKIFAWIAEKIDLEHRIPLKKISKVEQKGKLIKISFSVENASTRTLSIRTKNPDEFISLLNKQRAHAN